MLKSQDQLKKKQYQPLTIILISLVIIIYLPALFVQFFVMIGVIILAACGLIIFIRAFKFGFNLHFANGLRYNDLLFYAAILQSVLLVMLGAKYLNEFLERAADAIEEETTSKLDILWKFFWEKRKRTKGLYQKSD